MEIRDVPEEGYLLLFNANSFKSNRFNDITKALKDRKITSTMFTLISETMLSPGDPNAVVSLYGYNSLYRCDRLIYIFDEVSKIKF